MITFRKFLEADEPAPGGAGAAPPMGDIPGGIGGAPLPMGGMGGGPPMGGGMDPMGGGGPGMDPMGGPAPPTKTLEIKPIEVWELLEKILGIKKDAQDEQPES